MLSKKKWTQSLTIVGSLISLFCCVIFLLVAKRYADVIPADWVNLVEGLGTGNILAIIFRLRSLSLFKDKGGSK